MSRVFSLLAILSSLLLLVGAKLGQAQDGALPPSASSPVEGSSSKSHDDVEPLSHSVLRIWMRTPEDPLAIHGHFPAPNPVDGGRIDLFPKPTWVFVPHSGNPADIPSAVHDLYPSPDGYTWLTFRLQVSSPEVRQLTREKLMLEQRAYLEKRGKSNFKDIVIERWPLTHLALRFYDHRNNTFIAQGETQSLVSKGDQIEIKVPFTSEGMDLLLSASKANAVRVIPYYTYRNRQTARMERLSKVTSEVTTKILNGLESERGTLNGPLFQSQIQKLIADSKFLIETEVTASDPKMLAFLGENSAYIAALFSSQDKALDQLSKDELRALVAHAQPLVNTLQETSGITVNLMEGNESEESDATRHQNTKSSGVTTGVSGTVGAKATIGVAEVGGSVTAYKQWTKSNTNVDEHERARRAREQFEKSTGITLQKGKTANEYVPHRIRIFYVKEGAAKAALSESTTYAIGVGKEYSYLEDSPFFLHWTTDIVQFSVEEPSE